MWATKVDVSKRIYLFTFAGVCVAVPTTTMNDLHKKRAPKSTGPSPENGAMSRDYATKLAFKQARTGAAELLPLFEQAESSVLIDLLAAHHDCSFTILKP